MRLKDIIKDCGVLEVAGSLEIDIVNVTDDSRKVTGGSLFIAVKGPDTPSSARPLRQVPPPLSTKPALSLTKGEAKDLSPGSRYPPQDTLSRS